MKKFLRTEASAYLENNHSIRRTPKNLAKLATVGGGPLYCRTTREVLYDTADLGAWAKSTLGEPIASTSDRAA
ncbi:hypothetical protein [Niveispirillum sp. KHB5.9]|uniref:hypothetical protein n=1 Tax=Niveispirillum sp. KHB5.9 TaxID=3400269 RepID=UPI003A8806E5